MDTFDRPRSFVIVTVILLMLSVRVLGDGISVTEDLKHVSDDHTVIRLNDAQVIQVERKRTVTLTEEQVKPLRAIYRKVPKTIPVVSSRYDDCTCGMGVYAVWCRIGEIDVPHVSLEFQQSKDEHRKSHPPDSDTPSDADASSSDVYIWKSIIMDSKGAMYCKGRQLSEAQLLSAIDDIAKKVIPRKRVANRYIGIDTPPPIDKDVDDRILALLRRIAEHCVARNVDFHALGFREDKQWERRESPG